jgi:hypothetical protein
LGLQPGDAVILLAYGKVHNESLPIKEELQRLGMLSRFDAGAVGIYEWLSTSANGTGTI